ncbi:MAG TPA: cytidylate kinase-like family protein [Acidimicrobiales bacterium]|nr:cytidylate kinase-like family protein [Acidimicrobiales bacterium]
MRRLITISASYGAGGSVVAPELSKALGLPFLDRAISAADAQRAGEKAGEAATDEERTGSVFERLLSGFAHFPETYDVALPIGARTREEQLRKQAKATVSAFVADGEGVVLGWGGTVIIPDAYHVRLDGPPDRRLRQGMDIEGLGEQEARRRRDDTDRTRASYLRRVFGRDWCDPSLYHLTIDSTAIPLDTCTTLISVAATAFWES